MKLKKPIVLLSTALLVLLLTLSGCGAKYPQEELDKFAKCITESGAVMYGAFWCPHCARTKKSFGSAFNHIKYVECDPRGDNEQSELCIEEGIDKYDTWRFADGSELVSEPEFSALSEKTGCPMPQEAA